MSARLLPLAAAAAACLVTPALGVRDVTGQWLFDASASSPSCGEYFPPEIEAWQCGGFALLSPVQPGSGGTLSGSPVTASVTQPSSSVVSLTFDVNIDGQLSPCTGLLTGDMKSIGGQCAVGGGGTCVFKYDCHEGSCSTASRTARPEGARGARPVLDGVWLTDPSSQCYTGIIGFSSNFTVYQCESQAIVHPSSLSQGSNLAAVSDGTVARIGTLPGSTTTCLLKTSGEGALAGTCHNSQLNATCAVNLACSSGACVEL